MSRDFDVVGKIFNKCSDSSRKKIDRRDNTFPFFVKKKKEFKELMKPLFVALSRHTLIQEDNIRSEVGIYKRKKSKNFKLSWWNAGSRS